MNFGATLLSVMVALSAPAAELTGTWRAHFTGPLGDRPKMVSEITLELKAADGKLTGTALMGAWPGEAPLIDTSIEGDRVKFTAIGESPWWQKSSMGEASGLPKLTFTGTVEGDSMDITLVWDSVMLYGPQVAASHMTMRAKKLPPSR